MRQVAGWLGHADASFTLRTYVHLLDDGLGSANFLEGWWAIVKRGAGRIINVGNPDQARTALGLWVRSISPSLFLLLGWSRSRRAERRLAMATATKRAPTAEQVVGGAGGKSESAAMAFVVFEDNDGDYHWTIVAAGGESLAQSGSFASHDDAERAARRVYEGAGSARFEARAAEEHLIETA
jgi:uncharacterized protein YegP (UPF0339 family)